MELNCEVSWSYFKQQTYLEWSVYLLLYPRQLGCWIYSVETFLFALLLLRIKLFTPLSFPYWSMHHRYGTHTLKWSKSSLGCCSHLNWPELSTRRQYLSMLTVLWYFASTCWSKIFSFFPPHVPGHIHFLFTTNHPQ